MNRLLSAAQNYVDAWASAPFTELDSARRELIEAAREAAPLPKLPAGQTITLGDEFPEPHMELTQKPMGADDFILDLLADAAAHDERRGL